MALSTKIAVIDVGSNSSKVLISNVSRDWQVNKIIEKSHACRLIDSEYSKTRRLSDESQQNLIDVLSDLLSLCESQECGRISSGCHSSCSQSPTHLILSQKLRKGFHSSSRF